ncbi:MAG: endopolygalacturonase, partial [Planctomycetota bacterium]
NPERNDPEIRNDGGELWILGFKTEHYGTAVHTLNGGRTEILGGTCNQHKHDGAPPVFINDASSVSVTCGFTDYREVSYRGLIAIAETREGHTRRYPIDHLPKRDAYLPALPLYVGRAGKGNS